MIRGWGGGGKGGFLTALVLHTGDVRDDFRHLRGIEEPSLLWEQLDALTW